MENRIKIDGTWYVKEHSEDLIIPVVAYDGRTYETNLYRFEVSRVHDDEGKPFEDAIDIEITNKTVTPFKISHSDNPRWLIGVINDNKESLEEAGDVFNKEGLQQFKYVIQDLIKIGWLKK